MTAGRPEGGVELYHFSEDPGIVRFEPHVAKTSEIQDEALVWAIDDWHAPMYYTPRDCPRACFWAGEQTSDEDRERWLAGLVARFVMIIESGWLERLRTARLYRYVLPEAAFTSMGHEGGHWVSRAAVEPLRVEPVEDLLAAIAEADVELRVTPRLGPLWRRVWQESTLEFSGTRLRNALGWPEEFGDLDV
jgi:hypothetical protein